MNANDLGHATVQPAGAFPIGATGTWTITYTVGKHGIDDGGAIIIIQMQMRDATNLQTANPTEPGYITATTNGGAKLKAEFYRRYWTRPCRDAIVIQVYDGSLSTGDQIQVVLGDSRWGGAGWTLQTFPETEHRFYILVDAFGTRDYYPIPNPPAICIVPGPAKRMDAILPSCCLPNTKVPLRIRVMDLYYNPLDDFQGILTVDQPSGSTTYALTRGIQEVDHVSFASPGIYRLRLTCGDLQGESNPVRVEPAPAHLFWADLHGQTQETLGTNSISDYFRFARDKALLDVSSWQGNDFQVTDATWQEVCRQVKSCHAPGRFIPFLGYEWSGLTPAGGDHNILFLHDDQPIHRSSHWQIPDDSPDDMDRYPLSELWQEFNGRQDVMAIAHVGGRYANLDYWNKDFSGLIEVHSHHGTFEWLLHEAIRRKLVFGVVGQSDDHSGRPGLSAPLRSLSRDFATFDVFGGLTGVYADALEREAIWQALRRRHCYATTGARIVLDLRYGQNRMGDVVTHQGPITLQALIGATAPLLDVLVQRDSEVVYRHPIIPSSDTAWVRVEWSGVRVKSRNKIAEWPIRLCTTGTRIEAITPYGFRQPDEGARQIDDRTVEILSRTSGDLRGLFVKVSKRTGELQFESPHLQRSVSFASLSGVPQEFSAGGVNLAVRFSAEAPDNRPVDAALVFTDPEPCSTCHAYWIKVVQIDGHMAWTSPIWVQAR